MGMKSGAVGHRDISSSQRALKRTLEITVA